MSMGDSTHLFPSAAQSAQPIIGCLRIPQVDKSENWQEPLSILKQDRAKS